MKPLVHYCYSGFSLAFDTISNLFERPATPFVITAGITATLMTPSIADRLSLEKIERVCCKALNETTCNTTLSHWEGFFPLDNITHICKKSVPNELLGANFGIAYWATATGLIVLTGTCLLYRHYCKKKRVPVLDERTPLL